MHSVFIAIAAYLVLVPLVGIAVDSLGGHDLARLVQVALLALCGFALLLDLVRHRAAPALGLGAAAALALIALLTAGSVLQSSRPAAAMREVMLIVGLAAVAASVYRAKGLGTMLPTATSLASALYALVVVLIVAMGLMDGRAPQRWSLFLGYDNHRFFNHVQTVALPLALVGATTSSLRHTRMLSWVALTLGLALLLASAGRGTMVALIVAIPVMWIAASHRTALPVIKAASLSLVAGLLFFWLLFVLLPEFTVGQQPHFKDYQLSRLGSDQARGPLWAAAWAKIGESPWLGFGPMQFAGLPDQKGAHPHNVYLQVAAEWGLPIALIATAAALWLAIRLLQASRRATDIHQARTGLILGGAWVAVLVDGLVSGNFVMPVSQVWIAVLLGWSLRWLNDRQPTGPAAKPAGKSRMATPIVLALVAAMQAWWVADLWPEATRLPQHLEGMRAAQPGARENPRFWSNGRI